MQTKIFLNIKDLVQELLKSDLNEMYFTDIRPTCDYILNPIDMDPQLVDHICLGLKLVDNKLYLIDFAFSEEHYIEYQQIYDLLFIKELDFVKEILISTQKTKKSLVLLNNSEYTICEYQNYEDLKKALVDSCVSDLEYCNHSNLTIQNILNLETTIGIRSKAKNTIWTVRGEGNFIEFYRSVFKYDLQFLKDVRD